MTKNETIQRDLIPAKHTQTVVAEMIPAMVDHMDEVTKARPGRPSKRSPELIDACA